MFKLLNKKKNNKGFTLVELVIVIAILALLVGLLAPQYTKYVEKSRRAADASNMNELVKVVQVYAGDTDNELPAGIYTITISDTKGGSKIEASGTATSVPTGLTTALNEAAPDWTTNLATKSKKWGTDGATSPITAAIEVKDDGGVSITYTTAAFSDYMTTKTTN